MDQLWQKITRCVEQNLSAPGYQTFLSCAKPVSFENQVFTVEVQNDFSREWLKDKCENILRNNIPELGHDTVITYVINDTSSAPSEDNQLDMFESQAPVVTETTKFNAKYSFDNFIVGTHNRFAFAASESVSKAPAKAYNPLFIYGSAGLGKTHLLHSIGLSIQRQYPHMKLTLVSCEKFTNDLINAIKTRTIEQFRNNYRCVDVLLVDDIQFLAGKEQTQEEFFHTFNDLYNVNKQIILTSDRSPKEIPTLEIRLRTRFEWGLISDIQPPDLETRIAILQKKMELNRFNISDEILEFIASQVPSNVREMEGALTRIVAYASLLETEVNLSIASNVIRDMVGIKKEKPLTLSQIQEKTCDYFNVSINEICSKSRSKEIVYARQICMYLVRELTNMSLPKIGEGFGKRDHTTVMHACDKVKTLLQSDEETKSIVRILTSNVKYESV